MLTEFNWPKMGPVAGSCEHGNAIHKSREFLDRVCGHQLVKKTLHHVIMITVILL
jgi:hypothetical protein